MAISELTTQTCLPLILFGKVVGFDVQYFVWDLMNLPVDSSYLKYGTNAVENVALEFWICILKIFIDI